MTQRPSTTQNTILDIDEVLKKKDFMKELLQKAAGLVRASSSLPAIDELKYYQNNEQIRAKQKAINNRILQQLRKVAQFAQIYEPVDLHHFDGIMGITDQLLENVDTSLDKMKKINAATSQASLLQIQTNKQAANSNVNPIANPSSNPMEDLLQLSTQEKPQQVFKDSIDNTWEYPFVPIITTKHYAQLPLEDVLQQAQSQGKAKFFEGIEEVQKYEFSHPYAFEIESLPCTEEDDEQTVITPIESSSLKQPVIYVDTEESLKQMIDALLTAKEIAIDLEHHQFRSFNGITCLIQISDRFNDYIVDVFKLWKHLQQLNIVTANPAIRKVLHGAQMDIQWLQRDFGVYIVNMFDTGEAARALSFPSYALAYLLSSIAHVQTDKKYQLADWRIRPIPKDMLSYARSDTHYLLNIYDQLRISLKDKAKREAKPTMHYIQTVLQKSNLICLKKYIKPQLEDEKYNSILANQRIILSDRKFKVLKRLLEWRYINAAKYDESPQFVLANDSTFHIVQKLPTSVKELNSVLLRPSYVAQIQAQDIINIVNEEIKESNNYSKKEQGNTSTMKNTSASRFEGANEEQWRSENETVRLRMEEEVQLARDSEYEVTFTIEVIEVGIEQFHGSLGVIEGHQMHSQSSTNAGVVERSQSENEQKLERITKSFYYSDSVDFYCDKYPFLKEAYQHARQLEAELIKKRDHLAYISRLENQSGLIESNLAGQNAEEKEKDEYMEFIKEKGPSSKPKEIEQVIVPDIPLSYEDQFKTNLKKRKYNFGPSSSEISQEPTKKGPSVAVKNTFDALIEQEFGGDSDVEEDERDNKNSQENISRKEEIQRREAKEREDFNALTDKIKSQINKEPKFRTGINGTVQGKQKQGNKVTNKFLTKFKKSGF